MKSLLLLPSAALLCAVFIHENITSIKSAANKEWTLKAFKSRFAQRSRPDLGAIGFKDPANPIHLLSGLSSRAFCCSLPESASTGPISLEDAYTTYKRINLTISGSAAYFEQRD